MPRTSATRKRIDPSLSRIRSAVTNGHFMLADVDHRSAWMRRLRDLYQALKSDFPDASEGEDWLIRCAAMQKLQLEMMETRWKEHDGEASIHQLGEYRQTAGALRRNLQALGKRRQKPVQSLDEYLAQRARADNTVNSEVVTDAD